MYICTFQRRDVFLLVCEVPLFNELLKTRLFWSLSKFLYRRAAYRSGLDASAKFVSRIAHG